MGGEIGKRDARLRTADVFGYNEGTRPIVFEQTTREKNMDQVPVSSTILQSLHRIHRQLQSLRERLAMGPKVAAVFQKKLAEGILQLEERQSQLKAAQLHATDLQTQLKAREEKLSLRRQQLLEAKSNADYKALKDQIAADESATEVLELETLEAMEKADQQKTVTDEVATQVEKRREEIRKHTEQYASEAPQMKADVARLEAELTREESQLSGDFRTQYQRLIRSKGADSFAPLDERNCTGCHTQITLQMYSEIVAGEIKFCRACGRILYLPDTFRKEDSLNEARRR